MKSLQGRLAISAALITLCALPIPMAAAAGTSTVWVAPGGSDSAAGTQSAPFATIQHAVSAVRAGGGTVEVRTGTYAQRVNLDNVTGVTVTAAPGEHPVLNGSTLKVPTAGDPSGMVTITGSTNVTVQGLEVTGYKTTSKNATPIGIYVHGGGSGITVTSNRVHDLGNFNATKGSMDMNAHGIAVYGDSPTRSVTNLTISANEVDHLTLGASESVVVNGNVDGWKIAGNHVHDNNNIGIDAIGYEDIFPDHPEYQFSSFNRARNGVISSNVVDSIISQGNPAYYEDGAYCNCADGLYVDGGTAITISQNTLNLDDIGVEVAAENPKGAADHIAVKDNSIQNSRYVGIATGGYCDGNSACGGVKTGKTSYNVFTGNTLKNNNTLHNDSPEFMIQYNESNDTITGNTICAAGGLVTLGTVPRSTSGSGTVVDNNVYSAAGATAQTAQWGWAGKTYTGLAAYRAATHLDANSQYLSTC